MFEILQDRGEPAVFLQTAFLDNLLSAHAYPFLSKCMDNGNICFRLSEQRMVQRVKLIVQLTIFREENGINVLRQA